GPRALRLLSRGVVKLWSRGVVISQLHNSPTLPTRSVEGRTQVHADAIEVRAARRGAAEGRVEVAVDEVAVLEARADLEDARVGLQAAAEGQGAEAVALEGAEEALVGDRHVG